MFFSGKRCQLPRLLRPRAKGLLADYVLPCQQRFLCLLIMQQIGTGNVNRVDFLILQKSVHIRIDLFRFVFAGKGASLVLASRIDGRKANPLCNFYIVKDGMHNGAGTYGS